MRRVPLALLLVATISDAQTLPYAALSRISRTAAGPPKTNPLDATGFPLPKDPPGSLELPVPVSEDAAFRIINAESTERRGDSIILKGNVEFVAQGYRVTGERAEGNLATNVFTISGNARVVGKDQVVEGERVEVNLAARTYRAVSGKAVLRPALTGGNLRDDLFVRGGTSEGSQKETRSTNCEITTCNLPGPHFHVDAGSATVRPGKRAILRDVAFVLLGRTILKLPFLVVPLDDRTFQNLPATGQSRDEGYFVKQRTGIPLRYENDFLSTRTDYMTKLGTGLGGDYKYDRSNLRGTAGIYYVSGPGMISLRNSHEQRFGKALSFGLDNTLDRNNYLSAPGSQVWTTRSLLTWRQRDGATTRLGLNRNQNGTETSDSLNQTITLGDERTMGKLRTQASLDYTTTASKFGDVDQSRRQADIRFNARQSLGVADATLEYQRQIPVGDNQGFFGGADRTPVLSLVSDAKRLFGESFSNVLPLRTELSIGEFGDPRGDRLTRQVLDTRFAKPGNTRNRFSFGTNGRVRQAFYSDDTAQYLLAGGFDASYRFTDDTSANLRYQYLRPEGYTPLSLDQTGRTHQITSDLSFRPQRDVILGAQTGFDFLQSRRQEVGWQQVGVRAEYRPGGGTFLLRSLGTYDTFQGSWSSVRFDATFKPRGNDVPFLSFGARYDGLSQVWTNANLYVDNLRLGGRTRVSAALAYNGITKKFDAQQYSLIYDLHCAEAVILFSSYATGFRSGNDVQFLIRLKALPFDTNFGLGRRGNPLGTSTGRG